MAMLRFRQVRTPTSAGVHAINKSSVLGRKLVSTLVYSGTYPPYDLALGKQWLDPYYPSDASYAVVLTKAGKGLRSRFGGYRFNTYSTAPAGFTIDASKGATSLLVMTVNVAGDGTIVYVDNAGWYLAKIKCLAGFFAASAWTWTGELVATSPAAYVLGKQYVVVARSTLTDLTLWIDGVMVAQAFGNFGNVSTLRQVTYTNNSVEGGTTISLGLTFGAALSDQEIQSLSRNPWQVFENKNNQLVVKTASVALPTMAYAASTTSAGSWASTEATHHEAINEAVRNDLTFISVTNASPIEFLMQNTQFPCGPNVEISYPASSTNGSNLTITLKQGVTTIMTRTHALTSTLTVYTQTLTSGEIALISAGAISVTLTSS